MDGNSGIIPLSANNNEETKDPYQVYTSPQDPCTFRVIPSSPYILKGIQNSIQVLFQIKTGKIQEEASKKRPSIDLAVVLDRSGSMGGSKINHAKEAIKNIIENMDSEDKLHFIVYDSEVDVIFEDGDLKHRELLIKQVDDVMVRGSTNISGGLETATNILLKTRIEGRTQRIYLFSDGLANSGLKTHNELFDLTKSIYEKKISTCTFGIGADFDEDLMKGIAEYGNSYYFYIERSEQIEKFVSAALGALLGTIGKDAILKVRGKNGGIVKKIYGFEDIAQGAKIGDIKQNNLKNILVELDVTPSSTKEEEEVLHYELSFMGRKDSEATKVIGDLILKNTEDETLLSKNIETEISLSIQLSADSDGEIVKLLEQNKVKEAMELKEKEIATFEKVVNRDPSGRIASLLEKAKQSLSDMKKKGNAKHVLKNAKYHGMLKRYDSADFMAL